MGFKPFLVKFQHPKNGMDMMCTSQGSKTSHGKCELDSHADTSVSGDNFVILQYTGQVCHTVLCMVAKPFTS